MAQDPRFNFRGDKTRGFRDDRVDDIYSTIPHVSSSGQGVSTDDGRINLGTFVHAQYTGLPGEQQSLQELDLHPDTELQYSPIWTAVDLSNQEYQWPDLQGLQAVGRSHSEDREYSGLGEGTASEFAYLPSHLPYNSFISPYNHDNVGFSASPRNSKRPISDIDGDDYTAHSYSSTQAPASKRLRRTNRANPQGTASTRRSKQPDPARRRKTTTRPARRHRIQGAKGAEHNPKGMTRINSEGQLEWREVEDLAWEPAGYHNIYRAGLIALDEVEGESYDQQPTGGEDLDPLNITSFCFSQQHWTEDKSSVLNEQGREVLYMLGPPDDWYHNPKVAPMRVGGMIMLDHDDCPVRDFEGVPKVLSTHIEPWRLEGLRRCTGMTLADFRARMPSTRRDGRVTKDLQTPQAFTNRMNHWRIAENVGAWLEREGSQQIKGYIKDQLPDPGVKTTESLSSLNAAQRKKVYGLNKGRYLNKSIYEHPDQDAPATASAEGVLMSDDNYQPTSSRSRRKRNRRGATEAPNGNGSQVLDGKQSTDTSTNTAGPLRVSQPSLRDTVAPPTPVVLQATNEEIGVKDGVDYRFMPPSSAAEATSIQAALYYTRADYAFWLREEAPATSVYESYISQYLQLQHQVLGSWDHARGIAPTLMGIGSWSGGWDMWQKPDASEEEFGRLLPGI